MERATAIIAAAGSGERLGRGTPKAFIELAGRPLLTFALETLAVVPAVDRIVVAVPPGLEDRAHTLAPDAEIVAGAQTRHATIATALAYVDAPLVVCHDAARPFATATLFERCLAALDRWDGAIAAIAVTDTVKRVNRERVVATERRDDLVLSQTPQAFRTAAIRDAHARATTDGADFTDDAACLEWAGYSVGVVPGEVTNAKITTEDDVERAEAILATIRHG